MTVADAQRRALVVVDEPHLLNAIQLYLEEEGFLVLTAQDGQEALRRVRDQLPNVLVLDVWFSLPAAGPSPDD